MKTLLSLLKEELNLAIGKAFADLPVHECVADVAPCAEEGFGHYQCNSALRLSKVVKKNPRQVAQEILTHFPGKMCAKIEVAGPGFINLTLSPDFLSKELEKQLGDALLGASSEKKQRIIVEFSSPNIAKELHVGHLRSTIIGESLARLFEFLGHDVLRLNHLGDWGTQFGMLIAYMEEMKETPTDLSSLMQWYKAAKKKFDEDAEFKKRAQQQVVALQAGDEKALATWHVICDISRQGFQQIYDLLGVTLTERGESFYNPHLKEVVAELESKGLVTISEGAKCVFLDGFQIPLMVQKSDGGYNYDTTDLAAIKHRIQVERADRIIVVVDSGQGLHMQMVFKAAEKAGWLDPAKVQADHVGFGLVLGADGKKFKTRSGDTEKLIDLLVEAVVQAKALVQEKTPDIDPAELQNLSHALGLGAVKYADLSSLRTKDYTFSYERMLRFEGNTAVFLLYAYVRVRSIQRKVGKAPKEGTIELAHPSEIALALHLRRFGETLEMMARDLLPNRLTDYLYELSEKFNAFFRDCRVEGSAEETSRLLLCELTARVLQRGLHILGLETVERM